MHSLMNSRKNIFKSNIIKPAKTDRACTNGTSLYVASFSKQRANAFYSQVILGKYYIKIELLNRLTAAFGRKGRITINI